MSNELATIFLFILIMFIVLLVFLSSTWSNIPKKTKKKISTLTYDSPESRVIVGDKEQIEKAIKELDPSATIQHFSDLQHVLLVSTILSTELISIFKCVDNVYKPVQLSKMLKENTIKHP
jgi:hypothetical protein